jgi:hypothetical protein
MLLWSAIASYMFADLVDAPSHRRASVGAVITNLPSSASDHQRSVTLEASRLIRTERSREFGHTVVLRQHSSSVRFEPVPEHRIVRVPFEFQHGPQRSAALENSARPPRHRDLRPVRG